MLYTIKNSHLTVTVSDDGAELRSILGADGIEYLWQGNPVYWRDRALNIFPYVARLTEGRYCLDGELYSMNIHGIAPYRRFHAVSYDDGYLIMELSSDEETLALYPRTFTYRVIYSLSENTLSVTYEVENRDTKTMYFGLGGHPGFNVPLSAGKTFEDYRLRFETPCEPRRIGFTEDCFLDGTDSPFPLDDGRFIDLRHDLFDDDAIVLRDMTREVTLESYKDPHSVTVSFPDMPYLGIWHMPKTDAPYVCIEPWCSLPASKGKVTVFEEQSDLISLDAGKTYKNKWTIRCGVI